MSTVERLVEVIRAMAIEDIRRRVAESRRMTDEEVEQRQRAQRRERAEQAAAALRSN